MGTVVKVLPKPIPKNTLPAIKSPKLEAAKMIILPNNKAAVPNKIDFLRPIYCKRDPAIKDPRMAARKNKLAENRCFKQCISARYILYILFATYSTLLTK